MEKLIEEAKQSENFDNYENLEKLIKQIEKFYGQTVYQTKESEIKVLKNRLAELNPSKYSQTNSEIVEDEMNRSEINENDLDEEGKKALGRLKNGTNQDPAKTDADKKIVGEQIETKKALKKLERLLTEYEKTSDEEERKRIREKIFNQFYSKKGNNVFIDKAVAANLAKIESILGISSPTQIGSFPTIPVIITGSLLVFLLVLFIWTYRKQREDKKLTTK